MKKLKRLFVNKTRASLKVSLYSKKMFGFAAFGAGFTAFGTQASAQVIIQDSFTNGQPYGGATMAEVAPANGLFPSGTDLPHSSWQLEANATFYEGEISHATSASYYQINGVIDNYAYLHNGPAVAINIQSNSVYHYTEPDSLVFSASLSPYPVGGIQGGATRNAVISAGFYSAVSSSEYGTGGTFLGLTLDGNGNLSYQSSSGSGLIDAAGTGIFDANGFATLSYQLTFNPSNDEATISDIVLAGTDIAGTYTTGALSAGAASIAYAGFGSGNTGGADVYFDSFTLSQAGPVPEPSTYALLASGVLALGAYQYRRRQRSG